MLELYKRQNDAHLFTTSDPRPAQAPEEIFREARKHFRLVLYRIRRRTADAAALKRDGQCGANVTQHRAHIPGNTPVYVQVT